MRDSFENRCTFARCHVFIRRGVQATGGHEGFLREAGIGDQGLGLGGSLAFVGVAVPSRCRTPSYACLNFEP